MVQQVTLGQTNNFIDSFIVESEFEKMHNLVVNNNVDKEEDVVETHG